MAATQTKRRAKVLKRDQVTDAFRRAFLKAMDREAVRQFGLPVQMEAQAGALDQDLPDLFRTLDAQVDRLAARYGWTLED